MKPRYLIPLILVALFTPSELFASMRYFSEEEMICSAEVIVIGTIEKVDPWKSDAKKKTPWVSGKKATVSVSRNVKGSTGETIFELFDIYRMVGRDPCRLKPGTYLMFLKKREGVWEVVNGRIGLRPIKKGTIEWYDSKAPQPFWPTTFLLKKQVLRSISNTMRSQEAAKKQLKVAKKQLKADLKRFDELWGSKQKEKRLQAVDLLRAITKQRKLPYDVLVPQVSPRVIEATKDREWDVQIQALELLTRYRGSQRARAVFRQFAMSSSPKATALAVLALRSMGDRTIRKDDSLMKHLLAQLQDNSNPVPYQTIRTIGYLKRPETINPLLEVWDARLTPAYCGSLLSAFQAIGRETRRPLLERMIDPKYKRYADQIARVLRPLFAPKLSILCNRDSSTARCTCPSCQVDPDLKKELLSTLNDKGKAKGVRRAVALVMSARGWEWPVDPLSERLMDTSEDAMVRTAAAESLAHIGTDECVAILQRGVLPKTDKRYLFTGNEEDSIKLLGETRNPKAFATLIELLKADRKETVIDAALALGRLGDRRASRPLLAVRNRKDAAENRADMGKSRSRKNIRNAVHSAMSELFPAHSIAAAKARSEGNQYDWGTVVLRWEQIQASIKTDK